MSLESSTSQSQPDASMPVWHMIGSPLLKCFTVMRAMGASDLTVERQRFQSSPGSSLDMSPFNPSATIAVYENRDLEETIDRLLDLAVDEGFVDGMKNRMSRSLSLFVSEHPVDGVQQLVARLNSERMNQGVAADIVRALGQIRDSRSFYDRVYIAECLLYSRSTVARDVGAVALEDLGNPSSKHALQRAIEVEEVPELKTDMEASLQELMRHTDVVHSEEA